MRPTLVVDKPKEITVPISLTAARTFVEEEGGKDTDPDPVLEQLAQVAGSITATAEKVKDTVTKVLDNRMATELKNVADAKNAASRIFRNVAPKLDGASRDVERAIEHLENGVALPAPKDAVGAAYAAEVRAALSRMPEEQRAKAVRHAIRDGEDQFVAAAVLGNVALSGLGPAERNALADEWKQARHGPTLQRIERLRAAANQFDRMCALLSGWSMSLFEDQNAAIAAAEKSAELAKAALANVDARADVA